MKEEERKKCNRKAYKGSQHFQPPEPPLVLGSYPAQIAMDSKHLPQNKSLSETNQNQLYFLLCSLSFPGSFIPLTITFFLSCVAMIFGIKVKSINRTDKVIHAGCQTTTNLIPHRKDAFISENLSFYHFSNLHIISSSSNLECFSCLCNKLFQPGWSDLSV